MIFLGAVGKLSKGHVLDVRKAPFERALKDYDPQLYVKWNPKKLRGWGCWEIRRKPLAKRPVGIYALEGYSIIRCEYVENDVENHVLDMAFMNYDQIRKIHSLDTWNKNHWIHQIDYLENKKNKETKAKALDELKYNIKQHKSAFREFSDLVNSGVNPAEVVTATKWEY